MFKVPEMVPSLEISSTGNGTVNMKWRLTSAPLSNNFGYCPSCTPTKELLDVHIATMCLHFVSSNLLKISSWLAGSKINIVPTVSVSALREGTYKPLIDWVAAIAPWFHQRLPTCGPRFESQLHHLHFFQFVLLKLYRENNKNKQKEAGIGPFFKQAIDRETYFL